VETVRCDGVSGVGFCQGVAAECSGGLQPAVRIRQFE
jgi:hypothetical protein